MYGVKREGNKWLLYKYSLVELTEYSIKLFNTFEEAMKERNWLNKKEWA